METGDLIREWHKHELGEDYRLKGPIVMGCPLWHVSFINNFLNYCLPSLRSTEVLPYSSLVVFADWEAEQRLTGLPYVKLRRLPEPLATRVRNNPEFKYMLLAAAHNILIHQAAKADAGFHMLVPDTIYSNHYFHRLMNLTKKHQAIAHTGFAFVSHTALPVLDRFCRYGLLTITASELGKIGWEHLNPQWASWTMDGIIDFDEMPDSHYIHWRGQDHVRIHCAHQSAAWIGPERCKKVTAELGGTVDSELPRYMAGDFYQPVLSDEMTYAVIAGVSPIVPRVPFDKFKADFWRFIGDNRAFLPIFSKPCVVPAPFNESAPDNAELDLRMVRLMERLRA